MVITMSGKLLIDANALSESFEKAAYKCEHIEDMVFHLDYILDEITGADEVDAVEVDQIKETKQYVLQVFDTLIETDKPLYEMTSDNSYYGGKLAAFEIARRLVNAALTDLCRED